jgi:hypothetical protein
MTLQCNKKWPGGCGANWDVVREDVDGDNKMDGLKTMDGGVVRIMTHEVGGLKKMHRNHSSEEE